jgi:AcrR family transcriptional regulator
VPRPRQTDPELRRKILATATRLIASKGADAMSMRELADECGVNVAAAYYYFDSKDALLRAVIDEQHYPMQLHSLTRPDNPEPAAMLTTLIVAIWDGTAVEQEVWRLLLGESLRGNPTALAQARAILVDVEQTLQPMLDEMFPDQDSEQQDLARTIILDEMYAALLERIIHPETPRLDIQTRAERLARLLTRT